MKKYFLTILFSALPVLIGFISLPAEHVDAQQGCFVTQTIFRTTKPGGPSLSIFYQEDDRPFVYIDISTSGCVDSVLKFSLYRVNVVLGGGTTFIEVGALDAMPILVGPATDGQSNFTIAMRAGEENCLIISDLDCIYFFRVEDSSGSIIYTAPQTFEYDCEGMFTDLNRCIDGSDWEYMDIIPVNNDLGGTGGLDPYGPGNTTGNTSTVDPSITPDDPEGESVIDLSIENPLAGTIDTIPQFLQKVVEFVIKIGIPLVAMAIVYSGFLFVTARGSDDQLKQAKGAFTYAVIGGLVLLSAWLVGGAIKDALLSI